MNRASVHVDITIGWPTTVVGVELEDVNAGEASVAEDSGLTVGGLLFMVAAIVVANDESKLELTVTMGSGGGGAAVGATAAGATVTGLAICEEAAAARRAALCIWVGWLKLAAACICCCIACC